LFVVVSMLLTIIRSNSRWHEECYSFEGLLFVIIVLELILIPDILSWSNVLFYDTASTDVFIWRRMRWENGFLWRFGRS